jgi:hypothetical protein
MRSRACSFPFFLGITSVAFLRSESHGTHEHILLSLFLRLPNLEGQVPVFISPGNRVAQLYPRALGSIFVTSYVSGQFLHQDQDRVMLRPTVSRPVHLGVEPPLEQMMRFYISITFFLRHVWRPL